MSTRAKSAADKGVLPSDALVLQAERQEANRIKRAIRAAELKAAKLLVKENTAKEKAARQLLDKEKAAADLNSVEALAAREQAVLNASRSDYPGFNSSALPLNQENTQRTKRRRVATSDLVEQIFVVKHAGLQSLVDVSAAVGDTVWWEEKSATTTIIVATKSEELRIGHMMMVVKDKPDMGEVVDDEFHKSSSQIVLELASVMDGIGEVMVKYIGATAIEFDDSQLVTPVGCPLQHHVMFKVIIPREVRRIQGSCNAPLFRAGILIGERANEVNEGRRRVGVLQSSHLASSAGVGMASQGESELNALKEGGGGVDGEGDDVEIIQEGVKKNVNESASKHEDLNAAPYYLYIFGKRIGTNDKADISTRSADLTFVARAQKESYWSDSMGNKQRLQVKEFVASIRSKTSRISRYGPERDQYAEASMIGMLYSCPILENLETLTLFMKGDWSGATGDVLCLMTSFMNSGAVQCDKFISKDRFVKVIHIMWVFETSCVVFLGLDWIEATVEFRTNLTARWFPADAISSEVVIMLLCEAVKDTFY